MTGKTGERGLPPNNEFEEHYTQFINLAVHDLQAPVRKLGVLTDGLIAKFSIGEDKNVQRYSERIHSCISEIQSLVAGFKELAEAIPENMLLESCDVGEIVNSILHDFSLLIKEKKAVITTGTLPVIQGDKRQLTLIFKELLENSFRFNDPLIPLKIDISCEQPDISEIKDFTLSENKSYYKIRLADNGIGMDPEEKKRIFQPLVRLHGKSTFRGNGLGLAIVKKIISNHHGVVYAGDYDNAGTQIILIIPENHN